VVAPFSSNDFGLDEPPPRLITRSAAHTATRP
jgi:hypothetical protein